MSQLSGPRDPPCVGARDCITPNPPSAFASRSGSRAKQPSATAQFIVAPSKHARMKVDRSVIAEGVSIAAAKATYLIMMLAPLVLRSGALLCRHAKVRNYLDHAREYFVAVPLGVDAHRKTNNNPLKRSVIHLHTMADMGSVALLPPSMLRSGCYGSAIPRFIVRDSTTPLKCFVGIRPT